MTQWQGHLVPGLQLLLLGSKASDPLVWLAPEILVWLALSHALSDTLMIETGHSGPLSYFKARSKVKPLFMVIKGSL